MAKSGEEDRGRDRGLRDRNGIGVLALGSNDADAARIVSASALVFATGLMAALGLTCALAVRSA